MANKIKISATTGNGKTSTLLLLAEGIAKTHRVAFISDELTTEAIADKIKFLNLDLKRNFYVITTTNATIGAMDAVLLDVHDTVLRDKLVEQYEATGVEIIYYIE